MMTRCSRETGKGLTHIVSPDARDGTLRINQDAHLYQLLLDSGQTVQHKLVTGRTLYVHVVSGHLDVNEYSLEAGDGIGLSEVEMIQLSAQGAAEALVFDLP